jgi:hypothetical protein
MSQPRVSLWAAEDIDDDLQVDVNLAIGNYGQNGLYEDGACSRSFLSAHSNLRCAAQPRIDEATLVAVQHQMAQQAAFSQIPDAVKRVRIAPDSNGTHVADLHVMYLFLLVHRSLPSSRFGEQSCRDNGRLRQRLEPTHGKALCKNRMARSGGHCAPRQRRFVRSVPALLPRFRHVDRYVQINCSSSFIASYTTGMCTLVYNPTSTTASIHTRTAASSSTIY